MKDAQKIFSWALALLATYGLIDIIVTIADKVHK